MSAPYTPTVSTVSITTGGTSQVLLAAEDSTTPRTTVVLQPQTEACLINFGLTAGTQATGTLTAGANPANAVTIAVNGVTFTFVTGASTSTNVHIGSTKEDTMTNFAAVLNASANASVSVATYTVSGAVMTVSYDAGGTDGNAFTLADSSGAGAVTKSGATLSGGSNTAGGIYLAQYQPLFLDFPYSGSLKSDIYVLSATTSSVISYLEGNG